MPQDSKPADEYIEVNGIRVCMKQAGQGVANEPPMVFVHGLGYAKENMDPLFEYYKVLHHVVSYDVRGHGRTDKPASWTLEDDANDLHGLVQKLKLEKPVAVGFSMGSYIVLATAEKYPDLFSAIVLIGTKGGGASSTQAIAAKSATPAQRKLDLMKMMLAPGDTPPEVLKLMEAATPSVHLTREQHEAIYASINGFDNLTNAGKVTVPALCLTGQYDRVNPPAKGKEVADALPRGRFREVPRAGHITFFENFDYTVARMDDFFDANEIF